MLRGESCGGSPVVLRSGSDAASCRCLASTSAALLPSLLRPGRSGSCGVMDASDAMLLEVNGMTPCALDVAAPSGGDASPVARGAAAGGCGGSTDGEGDTRCSAAAALIFGGVDRACERPAWNSAFLSAFLSTGSDASLASIAGRVRDQGNLKKVRGSASCTQEKFDRHSQDCRGLLARD
jgi:hypothetical protein